jgi:hypothetical protein
MYAGISLSNYVTNTRPNFSIWMSVFYKDSPPILKGVLDFFVHKTKRLVREWYLLILGVCELAPTFDAQHAAEELKNLEKLRGWLLKYEALLEKSDYMDNRELKETWVLCLDALFKLEDLLRTRIKTPANKLDKDMIKAVSAQSKRALADILD